MELGALVKGAAPVRPFPAGFFFHPPLSTGGGLSGRCWCCQEGREGGKLWAATLRTANSPPWLRSDASIAFRAKRSSAVFVAATTRCFPDLSFAAALQQLVDLEYTNVELMLHESNGHLKPSAISADLEEAVQTCRQTYRLTPCALSLEIDAPEPQYYTQFADCCKLAKAIKVVTVVVRAAELGTPFNAEVERLREMTAIATVEGVRVGLLTEVGRMTQDPDTAVVLCGAVKGLGIALDPSHYIYGPHGGAAFDQVFDHVYHVRLRDTSKEQLQVRVGQGLVEYGRLVNQLNKAGYDRALSVDLAPLPGVEQAAEMRKMRLLLESLV